MFIFVSIRYLPRPRLLRNLPPFLQCLLRPPYHMRNLLDTHTHVHMTFLFGSVPSLVLVAFVCLDLGL